MQISVARTGGIAGVHQQLGPVDLGGAAPEIRSRITAMIRKMDFFDLPDSVGYGRVFDGFRDLISIKEGDRSHKVRLEPGDEDPNAAPLAALVRALTEAGYDFVDQPRRAEGA